MTMLSKHNSIQRDQIEMIALDQLVPANHLVRKMEAAIDFTFIYDLVKDMYSEIGRPSIDPVILVIQDGATIIVGGSVDTRTKIIKRAVQEIQNGMNVNPGIGMPTLLANEIPEEVHVLLQSENGLLGIGPYPVEGMEDPDLINAGKETVTAVMGGS